MVCCAETYFVSVSLCPPVFRLRENNGNIALATSTLSRDPAGIVMPVCHRSSVYSYTSLGLRNSGVCMDLRYRARILPCVKEKISPSLSTSIRLTNQSVSRAEEDAESTAEIGPANVSGLVSTSVWYTRM